MTSLWWQNEFMPSKGSEGFVRPEDQRAGDSDRKQVAERLRVALDEGRLDLSEYDERLQQSFAAKTFAELDQLTADIPGTAPLRDSQLVPAPETSVSREDWRQDRRERRRGRRGRPFRERSLKQIWAGLGGSAIFFTGLWALSWVARGGDPPYYWPAWILGFWAIGAAAATWSKFTRD